MVFKDFKILADEKKTVFQEDIISLVQKRQFADEELDTYELVSVKCAFETGVAPEATVVLKSRDGKDHTAMGKGDGPIDAIYNAIDKITGLTCRLVDYQVMSKTKGRDALGEVTVRVVSEKKGNAGQRRRRQHRRGQRPRLRQRGQQTAF